MIQCAHKDCRYEAGWTHKGGDKNKLIDRPEGDFYKITSDYADVIACRFHGDNNKMELLGCPKCRRVFMSAGEYYLDTTDIESELQLIDRKGE